MSADPISCTLLAAASLSTGLRRKMRGRGVTGTAGEDPVDGTGTALALAQQRLRLLHIPDSAIRDHLVAARARGQSDLSALNDLIAKAGDRR